MNEKIKSKLLPISLTVFVVIADQLTKYLVIKNIPPYTIGAEFFGDFLRIIHVTNTGVAFSVGATWSDTLRRVLFSVIPVIVIAIVFIIYFRNNEWNNFQRWMIMGILGGGIGNLADRIFRAEGVIDFIDIKFYGIFGLERWPTFNVADSVIIICGIMIFFSFIFSIKKEKHNSQNNQ